MIDLRKMTIDILCDFGKFGVGKSLTLGMYDFETPICLMPDNHTLKNDKNVIKNKNEIYHDA